MFVNDLAITSLETITAFHPTSGAFLWMLDELQSATISNTEETTDITGKQGRLLNSLKRNKAVTISGNNGLVSGGLLATQTGGAFEKKVTTIMYPDYLTVESNKATTSFKAVGTAGNEIESVYVRNSDGTLGQEFKQAASAGDGTFAYNPTSKEITFAENALIKAKAVYEAVKLPTIADDSGLCVDAMDGRPGVYSARYAPEGQHCAKLLEEMKYVPDDKRGAAFECTIAYIDESGSHTMTGECRGAIGYEQRGTNGFGYDPVFMVGDRTMAELAADEKNAISHRGAALTELFRFLKER